MDVAVEKVSRSYEGVLLFIFVLWFYLVCDFMVVKSLSSDKTFDNREESAKMVSLLTTVPIVLERFKVL